MWLLSPSPLLLLLSFSSLCLLSGVLLLDGGQALSFFLSSPSASALSPWAASSSAASSLPPPSSASSHAHLLFSRSPLLLPSASVSPSSLMADYQTAASAVTAWPGASPAPSACYASLLALSPLASDGSAFPAPTRHHLLPVMDDPRLNSALSWDTGHALLQLLAALQLALSLRLSLVASAVFPQRPHWDAFLGVVAEERKEVELQMEFEHLRGFTVRQQSVAQEEEELRRLLQATTQPALFRLEETQLKGWEEGAGLQWLADRRLLNALRRKYCIARSYRPVPVDYYQSQRLSQPSTAAHQPIIVAVHVQWGCGERGEGSNCAVEDRSRYVDALTAQIAGLVHLLTDGSLLPYPAPVSVHLFADSSALAGEVGDEGSRATEAELAERLQQRLASGTAGVVRHHHSPAMWAMHHYITADLFLGDLRGSIRLTLSAHRALMHTSAVF